MDEAFHYPPELFNLLVQTIPRLCKSKSQVILFFKGAGVDGKILAPIQRKLELDKDSVKKFDVAETVLTRLNEQGDRFIAVRREIIKRVVEFEDFTTCWENDRLIAAGYVEKVRQIVNVKDSFTRMNNEREAERVLRTAQHKNLINQKLEKKKELDLIKTDLLSLFAESNRQKRGTSLESVLNRLFAAFEISVTEAFTLSDDDGNGVYEQIDGVIGLDGEYYLVEMKWWTEKLGPGDVSQHMVRVFSRGQSRGIFISNSGYTDAAIKSCREGLQKTIFVLCELEELVLILEREESLTTLLRRKIEASLLHKNPLHKPLTAGISF